MKQKNQILNIKNRLRIIKKNLLRLRTNNYHLIKRYKTLRNKWKS